MARYPIPLDAVISNAGVPMPNASVLVRNRATGTNATVYQAETGPGTKTNPLSTDAAGRVAAWVAEGLYELVITAPGFSARTIAFDGGAQSDAGAGLVTVSLTTTGNISAGGNLTVQDITADDVVVDTIADAAGLLRGVPIGIMLPWAGAPTDPLPARWLWADGSEIVNATWPELAALLGTRFGSAAAGKTKLPDTRGRTFIGAGTGAGLTARTAGATGGSETHQLTVAQMPSHTHTVVPNATLAVNQGSNWTVPLFTAPGAVTGSTGNDQPHPNMQPWLAATYIIRAA